MSSLPPSAIATSSPKKTKKRKKEDDEGRLEEVDVSSTSYFLQRAMKKQNRSSTALSTPPALCVTPIASEHNPSDSKNGPNKEPLRTKYTNGYSNGYYLNNHGGEYISESSNNGCHTGYYGTTPLTNEKEYYGLPTTSTTKSSKSSSYVPPSSPSASYAEPSFGEYTGFPASVNGISSAEYRKKHEITVRGGDHCPIPIQSFDEAPFGKSLIQEIQKAGFSEPTPIQAQCWSIAMQGLDMIGVAKTGSGKTCGYLLPGFMHIQKLLGPRPQIRRGDGAIVLVLAPTRELAVQIEQECLKFGRSSGIMSACVFGGAPKWPQKNKLQNGIHVMIGTPGRINDFLEAKPSPVNLSRTSYLVLDEADRMLDMGFEPQIRSIIEKLPAHQTLMFTATWPRTVAKLAREFLRNAIQINIGSIELKANTDVTQYIHQVKESEKPEKLVNILSEITDRKASVIVFCNKKADCDALANTIYQAGWGAQSIHGDKEQWQRQQALDRFTRGQDPVIVATDVAARGLDIKGVSHVINYDFPPGGVENWIHRVGRTGRAGATGIAHTFFDDYADRKHAKEFVKVLKGSSQEIPSWLQSLSYQFYPSKKGWGGGGWGGRGGRGGSGRGGSFAGRGRGSWGARGGGNTGYGKF